MQILLIGRRAQLLAAMPASHARLGELPFDRRRVHKLAKVLEYRAKRLRG